MAVIVSYAFFKKPSGVGRALWKCGRALAQWKLLVLFGSAVLYSALIVYGAKRIDLWHEEALKVMIYWLIATGIVLLGEAVGRADPGGPAFRRRVTDLGPERS